LFLHFDVSIFHSPFWEFLL
jgi:hypothetical protein